MKDLVSHSYISSIMLNNVTHGRLIIKSKPDIIQIHTLLMDHG